MAVRGNRPRIVHRSKVRGSTSQFSLVLKYPMPEKLYSAYILASAENTTVYVGVTSDLKQRVFQHKSHLVAGFTKRYNIDKLFYYETCGDVISAIEREKQLKSWPRHMKNKLIETMNPEWRDLYNDI
jgi:putative endonuclease